MKKQETIKAGIGKGFSKGQYPLNKNGMPLDKAGVNPLSSESYKSNKINKSEKHIIKTGKYRPTPHNISDI